MEMLRISFVPVGNTIQFTLIIYVFVWDNCYVVTVFQPIMHTNSNQKKYILYATLLSLFALWIKVFFFLNHMKTSGYVIVFYLLAQSGSVVMFIYFFRSEINRNLTIHFMPYEVQSTHQEVVK